MTWMMTVRETPLVRISSRSCSTAASSGGGLAPGAKGNVGSCFQTWTWESMSGTSSVAGDGAMAMAAEVARNWRRLHILAVSDFRSCELWLAGAREQGGG